MIRSIRASIIPTSFLRLVVFVSISSVTLSMWFAGTTKPSRTNYLRLKVFLNGATEIFRAGLCVAKKDRNPPKNILPLLPVCSRYRRTTPREELARSYHIPVPTTTRSADQLQHRSDSGCPLDPAQSRQVFWSVRYHQASKSRLRGDVTTKVAVTEG